jgi:hypothetical protein
MHLTSPSKAVGEDAPHAVKIEGGEGEREGEVVTHCLGSLGFVVATQQSVDKFGLFLANRLAAGLDGAVDRCFVIVAHGVGSFPVRR